jgi:hypothetical protein
MFFFHKNMGTLYGFSMDFSINKQKTCGKSMEHHRDPGCQVRQRMDELKPRVEELGDPTFLHWKSPLNAHLNGKHPPLLHKIGDFPLPLITGG